MVSVSDEGEKERTDAAAARPTPLLARLLWTCSIWSSIIRP
jgi:hypothetical protein